MKRCDYLEYPILVYLSDDFRENYFKSYKQESFYNQRVKTILKDYLELIGERAY